MSHTSVNVPVVESAVTSGNIVPFSELPFPQKLGKHLSPGFQSTYRPRITAGALLRSHSGRAVVGLEVLGEHATMAITTVRMEMMICFFILLFLILLITNFLGLSFLPMRIEA